MKLSSFIFQFSTLRSSFLRELRRMTSRPIYLVSSLVLPLFLLLFMTTIFGRGQMVGLPVGVVDADNSATSRSVVRAVSAVPKLDVVAHYADDNEAREAVRRKEVYGYLSIPPRFEQSVMRGDGATLCYYYHYALLAVGGEVMSAFATALVPVSLSPIVLEAVTLGATEADVETFLLPMMADDHALYNPSLDYAVYLALPIYFIMFQVLVLLVTLFAVGSEGVEKSQIIPPSLRSSPYVRETISTAPSSSSSFHFPLSSLPCKLLPYTLIFTAEAVLASVVFFRWEHIPFAGDMGLFVLLLVLFIVATQSVALILYALFSVFSLVISVVSMVGSLGATLSGLTFPLSAMSPVVRWVAQLFPVRHFTEAMQAIVYYDAGLDICWPQLAVLCLFPLVMVVIVRLKDS